MQNFMCVVCAFIVDVDIGHKHEVCLVCCLLILVYVYIVTF